MKKYKFKAIIGNEIIYPKGFYYQKNHIILVGDVVSDNTIRRKEKISDVEIIVTEIREEKIKRIVNE